jgi:hypothetical protein
MEDAIRDLVTEEEVAATIQLHITVGRLVFFHTHKEEIPFQIVIATEIHLGNAEEIIEIVKKECLPKETKSALISRIEESLSEKHKSFSDSPSFLSRAISFIR